MSRRFDLLVAAGPLVIASLLAFVVVESAIAAEGNLAADVAARYGEMPLWLVVLVYGGFAVTFAWIGIGMLRGGRPPRTWGRSGDPRKR